MKYYSYEKLKKICEFLQLPNYKNKQIAIENINALTIENTIEPFTLESIKDIDDHFKFMWKQKEKYWCVDIRNLKKMFETSTIMPWALDFNIYANGLSVDSEDMKEFDMKHISGLYEFVNDFVMISNEKSTCTSFKSWLIFEIDTLMDSDSYINVDSLIDSDSLDANILLILSNISIQLLSETIRTLDTNCYSIFYEVVYMSYEYYSQFMITNEEHLKLLITIFKKFKTMCPNGYKNVLHVFFLEFESN